MKATFEWKAIDKQPDNMTARAKVEGGWLVSHFIYPLKEHTPITMTTTFVPDPQHNWQVEVPTTESV